MLESTASALSSVKDVKKPDECAKVYHAQLMHVMDMAGRIASDNGGALSMLGGEGATGGAVSVSGGEGSTGVGGAATIASGEGATGSGRVAVVSSSGSASSGDVGVATGEADRAKRRRLTEVLLDRVCLIASSGGAEHVLAPTLAGTRTAADNELKEELEHALDKEKTEAREHLQKLEEEMDELQRHHAATSAELHEARRAHLEHGRIGDVHVDPPLEEFQPGRARRLHDLRQRVVRLLLVATPCRLVDVH